MRRRHHPRSRVAYAFHLPFVQVVIRVEAIGVQVSQQMPRFDRSRMPAIREPMSDKT